MVAIQADRRSRPRPTCRHGTTPPEVLDVPTSDSRQHSEETPHVPSYWSPGACWLGQKVLVEKPPCPRFWISRPLQRSGQPDVRDSTRWTSGGNRLAVAGVSVSRANCRAGCLPARLDTRRFRRSGPGASNRPLGSRIRGQCQRQMVVPGSESQSGGSTPKTSPSTPSRPRVRACRGTDGSRPRARPPPPCPRRPAPTFPSKVLRTPLCPGTQRTGDRSVPRAVPRERSLAGSVLSARARRPEECDPTAPMGSD